MKNYDEMANDVFRRIDEYKVEQKRKKRIITRTLSFLCCICLVALIGIGGRQSGWFNIKPTVNLNDSTVVGESDYIDSEDKTNQQEKTILDYDIGVAASYATPDNNSFGISTPLRSAIKEYGDTARYMVFVDIFKDKEQIIVDKSILESEMMRLNELGYNAFIEVNNHGTEPIYYLCMEASKEQLESFDCNEDYGYFFFGKSERVE